MNSLPFSLLPFEDNALQSLPISITGKIALSKNQIDVCYQIRGDIDELHFPAVSQLATRKNELWNSTCCELFVGVCGETGYWEYNLSPSHDWAVFRFTDYRKNKSDELSISAIDIATKIDNNREFELKTILSLPEALTRHKLDVGISAVVKDKTGNIFYYALAHPGKQADFHDRSGFIIQLNAD